MKKTYGKLVMMIPLALTLALVISVALHGLGLAAVWTDLPDYSPGSVVTIHGDASDGVFLTQEIVHVDVAGPNGYTASCEGFADENGNWSCDITLWDSLLAVGSYSYTAKGMTSGIEQTGTFTDAPSASVFVTADPAASIGGTFKITRIQANNGNTQTSGGRTPQTFGGIQPNSSFTITEIQSPVKGCTYSGDGTVSGTTGNATTTTTVTLQYSCPVADTTPPVISYVLTPSSPDGSNGWYKSDVTLVWSVTDDESNVTSKTGCINQSITADQAATSYSCSASSAGGSSGPVTVTIKRDATPPTITFMSRLPAANLAGWNNSDVTVNWSCDDASGGSGVDTTNSVTQIKLQTDGANQSATGTCKDLAGNTASNTVSGINIDKTAPTASASASPLPNANGWNNTDVTVSFTGDDGSGSGIASCTTAALLSSEGAGQSASGTCTDKAGNVSAVATKSGVNIDKSGPSVSITPDHDPNAKGWYNSTIKFAVAGTDALSDGVTCGSITDYSGPDNDKASVSAICTDAAGNTGSGNFDFKYDGTAPIVTVTPDRMADSNDWYNHKVTFEVKGTDALSGGVTCGSIADYSTPDDDKASVSATCTDAAGNIGSGSFGFKYDATAPIVTVTPDRVADSNDWYNHKVTFAVEGTDALSGGVTCGSIADYSTPDDDKASVSATCMDAAGNTGSGSFGFKYDGTAPADVSVSPDRSADSNDYYNHAFTATWSGTDATSGIASCTKTTYSGPDTKTDSLSGACTDVAGNTSSAVAFAFMYDGTAPAGVSVSPDRSADSNDYYNHAFTATWSGTDATSGIASCTKTTYSGTDTKTGSLSGTCTDVAGNTSSAVAFAFMYDATAPADVSVSPDRSADSNGYYNHAFIATWSGTDATSGIASCTKTTYSVPDTKTGSLSGTCTDVAGNTSGAVAFTFMYDGTAPTLTWNGGPANVASYYFGFVPAAPTCTAADALSGPNGCSVTGYDVTVGPHKMTATAHDIAGNSYSEDRSYTVLAWTLKGFYQPVDMNGVYNTVKNGSTVPLKFEIFAGPTELIDVANVKSLMYGLTPCDANAVTDEIETIATGNTVLRYDATGGQFIYNWKTPNTAGKCYRVTMTTLDGSSLAAFFKLK